MADLENYMTESVIEKVFGFSQALSYLGAFLALFSGISVFTFVHLLLRFSCFLIPAKKSIENRAIPDLETRGYRLFHSLSDKLYHLKKDLKDFVRLSSIQGVRHVAGDARESFFWLAILAVATGSCVHFVRDLFQKFNQNEVAIEFDSKTSSVHEVFYDFFLRS